MQKPFESSRLATLCVALLVLSAACSPAAPPSPAAVAPTAAPAKPAAPEAAKPSAPAPAKPDAAPAPAKPDAAPAAAKPAAQPAAQAATLRIATGALGNEVLDPMLVTTASKIYLELIYDYLVGINDKGEPDPTRSLAEKWEISPDSTLYTFTIRKGVKFHNGDDVTAADVQFSLQRAMSEKSKMAYAGSLRQIIGKVEVPDPYTVRVQTKQPYPFLVYDLSTLVGNEGTIVPKSYIETKGDDNFSAQPVGSGPYKLADRRNGDFLKLQAVDKHWSFGVPRFKQVEMRVVPEEQTRGALLQRNETDIIDVSARKAKELSASGAKLFSKPAAYAISMLLTEQWLPPLDDVKVREALNIAIDRKAINDGLFEGLGMISAEYPINSTDIAYQPQTPYPYDPERAKQLLRDAGKPNPKIVLLTYPRAGFPEGPRMVEAIASMWKAIGVDVEIRPSDYAAFNEQWAKHALGAGVVAYINAGSQVNNLGRASVIMGRDARLDVSHDPKLDDLLEAAEKSPDIQSYKDRMGAVARYERENHITGPIAELAATFATSPTIVDWKFTKTPYSWDLLNLIDGSKAGS